MRLKKSQKQGRVVVETSLKKQRSFHYSARRSETDRQFGRVEHQDDAETATKKRQHLSRLVLARRVILVFVLAFIAYLLYLPGTVKVQNPESLDANPGEVEKFASQKLKDKPLNRLKITLDRTDLETKVRENYLGFSSVQASTGLFHNTVNLNIISSRPSVILSTGTNIYIVGQDGIVLSDVTRKKPNIDMSKLPLLQDQTGVPVEVGKRALARDQVDYILEVAFQCESSGLPIETMTMLPGGGELQVRFGGVGYYVKFNLYENARRSVGALLAVKAELDKNKIKPAEYIDVRVAERAYVK